MIIFGDGVNCFVKGVLKDNYEVSWRGLFRREVKGWGRKSYGLVVDLGIRVGVWDRKNGREMEWGSLGLGNIILGNLNFI